MEIVSERPRNSCLSIQTEERQLPKELQDIPPNVLVPSSGPQENVIWHLKMNEGRQSYFHLRNRDNETENLFWRSSFSDFRL